MLVRFAVGLTFLTLLGCAHNPYKFSETPMIERQNVTLTGHVSVADKTTTSESLQVTVNGITRTVDPTGQFSVPVTGEDIFAVTISGPDVYSSRHTFSQAELRSVDGQLMIPPITLVEKVPGRRLLTFGGDAMMGRRYIDPQWNEAQLIHSRSRVADMKSILATMKPYFEPADYAAINLETILAETEPTEHAPKSVVFYTHPDITEALEWMGVDYVSLGNNHTYDYLEEGLDTTLAALEASTLGYSGAGTHAETALVPHVMDLDGVPVSAWGYVGWEGRVTPNQVAEADKGGAAYGSEENIRQSLQAGVKPGQIDIVQYHGSREYSEGPSEFTERRLKLAIDNGADLVIAHHPHVTQGFELYKDKLIGYSLGNFAFDQFFYSTHAAAAVHVWMDGDAFYRAEIVPLHVKGYKPLPATNSVRDYVLDRVARLSGERNTIVSRSGGHGVIDSAQSEAPLTPSGKTDVLFVGDFESYTSFGVNERTWVADNATFKPVRDARSGRYSLEVTPKRTNQRVTFGLKTFMRVFPADKMRWQGYVKAEEDVTFTGYIQSRPKGMNRYKALEETPLKPIGAYKVPAGDWTQIQFDFDAPSWKSDPSRILLKIDTPSTTVKFDDIEILPIGEPYTEIGK